MQFEDRRQTYLDLGFRTEALPLLHRYVELLWSSNQELNLFSRQMTFEELIDNHIIDCLLPLAFFPKRLKAAADFGSGGGLPGVVYAIHFSQIEFHLYEKSPLKQEFLRKCAAIAPNIQVHGAIEILPSDVGVVTARGFKPLDVILDISRDYYRRGGEYFLLKARREKIDEEIQLARKKFKDCEVRVEPLKSPVLAVERNVLLVGRRKA